MTARSLHSLPARNMLRVVRQNRKMAIVTSILMIISVPLIMVPTMWGLIMDSLPNNYSSDYPSLELYIGIGAFCLAIAVFMGMFCAICSFTETHKKAQVDMLYALPLTGNQRFFSDYLGGACMYILPYIITVILGWIIIGVGCPFIHPNADERLWDTVGEIVTYYAMGTAGLFVLMLLYFTLCTLITVCCGTLFESIYANILLNGLIPGTVAAILGMISEHVDLSFEYLWQIIGFMSPIGGLCYLIYLIDTGNVTIGNYISWESLRGTETHSHDMMPNYFRWIVIILLLSAALLVAAWQLYKRRKAEHVGQPFVYIAAYHVMITLLIVLILCLLDFNVIGPVLLFAAIVYFVCEVIRKRGFKRFWLSIITFVVTVAVTVGAFALIIKTNCFGREYYVPAAATVSSVHVECSSRSYDFDFEFTDREVISQITDFHKTVAQHKKTKSNDIKDINRQLDAAFPYRVNYSYYEYQEENPYTVSSMRRNEPDYDEYYSGSRFTDKPESYGNYAQTYRYELTYYTITGSVVHRELYLTADELCDLRQIILDSKLCRESASSALSKLILQDQGVYDSATDSYELPVTMRFTIYCGNGSMTRAISGTHENIERLSTAYAHDLEKMSAKERLTAPMYCKLGTENGSVYKIYEGFDETIAVLEDWGFEKLSVPQRYDFVDADNPTSAMATNQRLLCIRIYAPEQWSTDSLKYPNSSVSYNENTYVKGDESSDRSYEDYILLFDSVPMKDFYPEMYNLLDVAQEEYISEEPCYCILVNGIRYIIPPKYNDLAKAVIEKGDQYSQDHFEEYCNSHTDQFPAWNNSAGTVEEYDGSYDEYEEDPEAYNGSQFDGEGVSGIVVNGSLGAENVPA